MNVVARQHFVASSHLQKTFSHPLLTTGDQVQASLPWSGLLEYQPCDSQVQNPDMSHVSFGGGADDGDGDGVVLFVAELSDRDRPAAGTRAADTDPAAPRTAARKRPCADAPALALQSVNANAMHASARLRKKSMEGRAAIVRVAMAMVCVNNNSAKK